MNEAFACQLTMTRGRSREAVLLLATEEQVLQSVTAKGATTGRNGLRLRGWRVEINPMSLGMVVALAEVLGPQSAAAKVLADAQAIGHPALAQEPTR